MAVKKSKRSRARKKPAGKRVAKTSRKASTRKPKAAKPQESLVYSDVRRELRAALLGRLH